MTRKNDQKNDQKNNQNRMTAGKHEKKTNVEEPVHLEKQMRELIRLSKELHEEYLHNEQNIEMLEELEQSGKISKTSFEKAMIELGEVQEHLKTLDKIYKTEFEKLQKELRKHSAPRTGGKKTIRKYKKKVY